MRRCCAVPHGLRRHFRVDTDGARALPGIRRAEPAMTWRHNRSRSAISSPEKLAVLPLRGRPRALFRRAGGGCGRRRPLHRRGRARSIEVEYEPRPAVVDPEVALAADAPVLHDKAGTNVVHERTSATAIRKPPSPRPNACRFVKVDYPRDQLDADRNLSASSPFRRAPDRYTVWSNFQGPFAMHAAMCDALRVPGIGFA